MCNANFHRTRKRSVIRVTSWILLFQESHIYTEIAGERIKGTKKGNGGMKSFF